MICDKDLSNELIEAQQQTIQELATPVIPVWSRVLMSPLMGNLDSKRMHDSSKRLLDGVVKEKPQTVVFDLSSLAHTDSHIVGEILRLIKSINLLGSKAVLSGIKPTMARSLVSIGADLEKIPTYATLEQALKSVIKPLDRNSKRPHQ